MLRLRRPCDRCETYFHPATRSTKMCNVCFDKKKDLIKKARAKTIRDLKKKIKLFEKGK